MQQTVRYFHVETTLSKSCAAAILLADTLERIWELIEADPETAGLESYEVIVPIPEGRWRTTNGLAFRKRRGERDVVNCYLSTTVGYPVVR